MITIEIKTFYIVSYIELVVSEQMQKTKQITINKKQNNLLTLVDNIEERYYKIPTTTRHILNALMILILGGSIGLYCNSLSLIYLSVAGCLMILSLVPLHYWSIRKGIIKEVDDEEEDK